MIVACYIWARDNFQTVKKKENAVSRIADWSGLVCDWSAISEENYLIHTVLANTFRSLKVVTFN